MNMNSDLGEMIAELHTINEYRMIESCFMYMKFPKKAISILYGEKYEQLHQVSISQYMWVWYEYVCTSRYLLIHNLYKHINVLPPIIVYISL